MSMVCKLVTVAPDKLQELIREPANVFPTFYPRDFSRPTGPHLDLDKMWHGLHYILTGTAWDGEPPLSLAILGGTEIGEDTGYGPPRYLTPTEVRAVTAALSNVPHDVFLARFDPMAMNQAEIYSGGWEQCAPEGLIDWLARLASFYHQAATAGLAVLICLS